MSRHGLVMAAALAVLVAGAAPAGAQTPNAEVRTWTGQTYQLAEPSLEVRYTIMLPQKNEGAGPSESAPPSGARTPMLFGSASAISGFLDKEPEPLQGHRQSEMITLRKDGTEIRLPLASVGALFFARQPARSILARSRGIVCGNRGATGRCFRPNGRRKRHRDGIAHGHCRAIAAADPSPRAVGAGSPAE